MAIESKSVTAHPLLEQEIIEQYEEFGWTLMSSQEILSQVGHTNSDLFFDVNSTETTNYVKLLFHREREFPNADKIRELEEEYWANYMDTLDTPSLMPGKIGKIWIAIYTIPLLFSFFVDSPINPGDTPVLVGYIIFALLPVVLKAIFSYIPRKIEIAKANENWPKIRRQILELMNKA